MNELSVLQKGIYAEKYPYPHLVIDDCLPTELYNQLKRTRPHFTGEGSNKRYDISAYKALEMALDPVWEEFIKYHCSEGFYKEVDALFDLGLEGEVGMRNVGRKPIRLDCQISINTPVKEESQVCIAHIDNPETKWAGLLYMPDRS